MACVASPSPLSHFSHLPMKSFTGDQELLVDRLIAASQTKQVAPESLKERALVPFFDASEAANAPFESLQRGRRAGAQPLPIAPGPHHGLKRNAHERSAGQLSTSPPKKENEVVQGKHLRKGAKPAGPAPQRKPAVAPLLVPAAAAPHQGGKKQAPKAPAGASAQRQSPPRKPSVVVVEAAVPMACTPAKPATLLKFAGAAFSSPTPDSLPLPSSMLMQATAEGLRSRLTL